MKTRLLIILLVVTIAIPIGVAYATIDSVVTESPNYDLEVAFKVTSPDDCYGELEDGSHWEWIDEECIQVDIPSDYKIVPRKYIFAAPLKQIKAGVALNDIQCNDGKYVVYKRDRMRAACVTLETENQLIFERGWATMRLGLPATDDLGRDLCNWFEGEWDNLPRLCHGLKYPLLCTMSGGDVTETSCFIPSTTGVAPVEPEPEPERANEDEMNLRDARQKLREIYHLNSSFGPFNIKDAIVGYGIAGDVLVVDVLTEYYESDHLNLIKQKIRDIVGPKVTIEFSPSGAIVPTNIESVFPYVWNSFLHRNGIEFTPKEQTYANTDEGYDEHNRVCSPIVAANGTEFYISSTFIKEPFEITGTFIDKTMPDDCFKIWKTDTTLVEPDRILMLWLENYHSRNE